MKKELLGIIQEGSYTQKFGDNFKCRSGITKKKYFETHKILFT